MISVAAIALGLAAGGLAIANSSPGSTAVPNTVEVTGTASVNARPDTLTADLTVQVVRSSSKAALDENNVEMQDLQRALRRGGVPSKDIATSNLTVGRNYNSNGKASGYVAVHSLSVTLKNLAKAGSVISAAQASVGNDVSIDSISYSLVNVVGILNSARTIAVHNALAAARVLAVAAGSSVTGVSKITDQSTSSAPIPFNGAAAQKRSSGSVPLSPGTQSITATVDVVFLLSN